MNNTLGRKIQGKLKEFFCSKPICQLEIRHLIFEDFSEDFSAWRLFPFTDAKQSMLNAAVKQHRFTNSSLDKATKKSKQNVMKYLNRLLRFNFIYQVELRGRNVYYEISPDLTLLES